jgi:hypothetical protein
LPTVLTMLGKVGSIVTSFADESLKRQEALKGPGPQGVEKEFGPGDDKMPRILHKRGGEIPGPAGGARQQREGLRQLGEVRGVWHGGARQCRRSWL